MRMANAAAILIIIISFAIAIYLYPSMSDPMPAHWNAAGQVDSFMPKFWGLFLMPIVSIAILLLFVAIPRIDPLKKNIDKFRSYFDGFIVIILMFFMYIHILTLMWSMNITFNMTQMILPAIGLLFIYLGFIMDKLKRNWFIGIRTPWTLSSDRVWEKTHRVGGIVFKFAGVITFFGVVFQSIALWLLLIPIIIGIIYLFAYSYFEFQKEKK